MKELVAAEWLPCEGTPVRRASFTAAAVRGVRRSNIPLIYMGCKRSGNVVKIRSERGGCAQMHDPLTCLGDRGGRLGKRGSVVLTFSTSPESPATTGRGLIAIFSSFCSLSSDSTAV